MNCPNCKKEIDDDSNFCEFCGNKTKIDKGYKAVIEKILKENEKTAQKNGRKKRYFYFFKNAILILSVFVTVAFFLEATYKLDGAGLLLAMPMTLLVAFGYIKIAKKFNL